MNFLKSMAVSASGLAAQRYRLNILAANIANAETTRTPEGGPYRRRDVVFGALPAARTFEEELRSQPAMDEPRHVKVLGVAIDERPPILVYDPTHPDSNEEGYVAMPNINTVEEMTNLMLARRSYEANVAAFNATKLLAVRALDIGRA